MSQPPPLPPMPPGHTPYYGRTREVQLAKYSALSVLFLLMLTFFTNFSRAMPTFGFVLSAMAQLFLLVSGFVAGIVALRRNRKTRYPGVSVPAWLGVSIHGFFLLLNVVLISFLIVQAVRS